MKLIPREVYELQQQMATLVETMNGLRRKVDYLEKCNQEIKKHNQELEEFVKEKCK